MDENQDLVLYLNQAYTHREAINLYNELKEWDWEWTIERNIRLKKWIIVPKASMAFYKDGKTQVQYNKSSVRTREVTDRVKKITDHITKILENEEHTYTLFNYYPNGEYYVGKHRNNDKDFEKDSTISVLALYS